MKNDEIKPIFIFSLPRSGSTLLQRILGNHPMIHTVAEPWFLLPIFESLAGNNSYTEYSSYNSSIAIHEFIGNLPNSHLDLYKEINQFTLSIYTKIIENQKVSAKYFIDKTPRYHLIIDQIHKTFPDAKFIYLLRNPLSIISSMIGTDPKNYWNLYFYNIDLFKGLPNLLRSLNTYKSTSMTIHYESLIKHPKREIQRILNYLEIEELPFEICLDRNKNVMGTMGDRLDQTKEDKFIVSSTNRWKIVINNIIRKQWCIRYLRWLGKDVLYQMGYDMNILIQEIERIESRVGAIIFIDIYRIIFGLFFSIFEYTIVKNNLKSIKNIFTISAKT